MEVEQVKQQAEAAAGEGKANVPANPPEPAPSADPQAPAAESIGDPAAEISSLKEKLKRAEGESERHRRRADYAFGQMNATYTKQAQPPAPEPEPQQASYGDDQVSYVKAHAGWQARQEARQLITEDRKQQHEQAQEMERANGIRGKVMRIGPPGTELYQAWDAVGNAGAQFGTPLCEALFSSRDFEGVVKHLAKVPQEVMRILSMPEREQWMEVARIESELKGHITGQTAEHEVGSTAAPVAGKQQPPAPIQRVNGGTAPVAPINLNDPKVPIDQWWAEWNRQRFGPTGYPRWR